MPIQLTCPQCDAKMRAPDAVVGKQVKCPKCQTMFTAGVDAPPPAPPPAVIPLMSTPAPASAPEPFAQYGPADDEPVYRPSFRGGMAGDVPGWRTLISPLIGLHVIFWGGLGFCLYFGLRLLFNAFDVMNFSVKAGFEQMLWALVPLVIMPFVIRLNCEMFVVLYQILQTLRELRDKRREG